MIRVVVDGEEVASFEGYHVLWAWARAMAEREPESEPVTGMLPPVAELTRESENAA